MSTPPPLPPTSAQNALPHRAPPRTAKRGWRRIPLWAWIGIALVVIGGLTTTILGTVAIGRLLGEGWDVFTEDARVALQRNPTIQERIGTIGEMHLDFSGTGRSVHPDDFVFNVKGERGGGRVRARFESTVGGERILEGELRMKDGSKWQLAPDPAVEPDE